MRSICDMKARYYDGTLTACCTGSVTRWLNVAGALQSKPDCDQMPQMLMSQGFS